jgi:hypothetical protein
MDPVIRVGTKHEDSDRRMIILCMVGAAPFATLIALMYWLGHIRFGWSLSRR